jgi:hypothetical protein
VDHGGRNDKVGGQNQMIRPIRRDVHWSLEEDALLRQLAQSGESVANIAAHFKAECWRNPQPGFETEYALAKSQRRGKARK